MPIATLYKATGESLAIETGDYFTRTPGIAHGSPQPQFELSHIAELIGTTEAQVQFAESHEGQRLAYAVDEWNKPLNAYAAEHCVLKLHGDVLEVPYFNTIDYR